MTNANIGFFSLDHLHVESYLRCVLDHPFAKVAGIWHTEQKRGKETAARHQSRFFADARELAESGLDAAIVCSANKDHVRDAKLLATARIPTLCEKPLGADFRSAERIVELYGDSGTLLMTAFPCRFNPAIERARRLVQEGAIGRVMAACTTNRGTFPGGWFAEKKRSGGGAILDHTVHVVDLLRWILESEVSTVFAEASSRIRRTRVEDTGLLMMEFEDGTATSLDTSWSRPAKHYPAWGDVTLEFIGDAGVLSVDAFAQVLDVYSNQRDKGIHAPYGDDMDQRMIDSFLHAVTSQTAPSVTGADGLRAVEVAQAAYESIRTRKVVHLSRYQR